VLKVAGFEMMTDYRTQQKQIIDQLRLGAGQPGTKATVVPIKPDYRNDPAIALTSVVFVPEALGRAIAEHIVDPLKAIEPGHYYYPLDSLHLTVKNVRSVHNPPRFSAADVKKVDRLFAKIIPQHRSFTVRLEELVPFSTSLSLIAYSGEPLHRLVQALDAGLDHIGLPDDKRYVSKEVIFGNVTLCRYVQPPSERFLEAVTESAHGFRAELRIKRVHLITCNAVCAPEHRVCIAPYRLKC
jgi:2'-5' RNA ligase